MDNELSKQELAVFSMLRFIWNAKYFLVVGTLLGALSSYFLTRTTLPVQYASEIPISFESMSGVPVDRKELVPLLNELFSTSRYVEEAITHLAGSPAAKRMFSKDLFPISEAVRVQKASRSFFKQTLVTAGASPKSKLITHLSAPHTRAIVPSLIDAANLIIARHNEDIFTDVELVLGKKVPRVWSNLTVQLYLKGQLSTEISRLTNEAFGVSVASSGFDTPGRLLAKTLTDQAAIALSVARSKNSLTTEEYESALEWLANWITAYAKVDTDPRLERGYFRETVLANQVIFPSLRLDTKRSPKMSLKQEVATGKSRRNRLLIALSTIFGLLAGGFLYRTKTALRKISSS